MKNYMRFLKKKKSGAARPTRKNKRNKNASVFTEEQKSRFDPAGMYTGIAADGDSPVQDADDL
ncbi:MAG: hypothetical protein LBP79_05530 [Clostridiales bacterium]|jgi:hypothetical protein|nr:hypothetical protein [Clostridiales bacterium]